MNDYKLIDNQHQNLSGRLRITNPRTIRKWKEDGRWQEKLDEGLIYAKGCGRFREKVCTCHKCRRYITNHAQ